MASEIKIHLATYLKDAGIKASRQQVEKLSRDIEKMNRDAQKETDRTVKSLGKLPGAFGKIQDALGGFGAKALSVIGAFKVGWEIGTWLNDNVIKPLFNVKDPIEELKKHNRELKRQAEEAAAKWNESLTKWAEGWDKVVSGADRARQRIDDLTQSYLRMQAARERVQAAGDNAELLGLQRDKFNAMAGAATPEQAAQLGKYHDVLIAEMEAQQQLAKFDRDAETSARQMEADEKRLRAASRKSAMLDKQVKEAEKRLAYLESDQSVEDMGWHESNKAEDEMRKRLERLKEQRRLAERDEDNLQRSVWAAQESAKAAPQERENIIARTQLETDARKKAYDDYLAYVEQREAEEAEAEWNRQQDEIRRAAEVEMRERQRVEQQLAAQRISDLRKELSERQRLQGEAQSRQSAAEGGLRTAWGWYRNQSQMQAVIDERKAQAAAEVQWQKDFERLKTWRRDWRTADIGSLSAADEAVRQVAFAKEEKAAADRAVIETAENTRNLAEKIDELLAMKGGM